MHDYSMLSDGDRVLVGVSGGIDSLSLTWLLQAWQNKAPISYTLQCVYIDSGFYRNEFGGAPPADAIGKIMDWLGVDFTSVKARNTVKEEMSCYLCSRNRRSQLFDLAQEWKTNKIALGHHMDDLLETFFLNIMYSGNISTMVPCQKLFDGELQIIRPMAYLEKKDISEIAEMVGFETVKNYCPIEKDTRRAVVRELLSSIYQREPGAKKSLFRSLANVRQEYML